MYVCSAVLNLYNTNTPFADDQWVLLGAVPGRTLFALKHDTLLIMLALLASIVLTSLVTILITVRSVSQPIVKLAAEVRATDPAAPARLQKRISQSWTHWRAPSRRSATKCCARAASSPRSWRWPACAWAVLRWTAGTARCSSPTSFSTYSAVRNWRAPCAAHSPSRERWMPCTSM